MSNPLKHPAPVLPAMGLHSFHNDSPPFAGAGTYDHPEPDHLSLDAAGQHQVRKPSPQTTLHNLMNNNGVRSPTGATFYSAGNTTEVVPGGAPYTGTRHNPNRANSAIQYAEGGSADVSSPPPSNVSGSAPSSPRAQPRAISPHANLGTVDERPHSRVPTADDERLSTSRSKQLVSGYHFGNPRAQSNDGEPSSSRRTTPPGSTHGSDSPPLTEADGVEEASNDDAEGVAEAEAQDVVGQVAKLSVGAASGNASGSGTRDRRNSRVRDIETGYDRLNGLNDGEADLDETAPQGPGGTEDYLNGLKGYNFPKHRLRTTMKDESKIPVVIVACGSFSPPTYLHLRMFEMAKDEVVESQTYEIMAGYYSPVSSYYKKAGLAPAMDRVRMCELAVEHTSTWLMVDPWEAGQPEYQRTAVVLEHFDEMLNGRGGGGGTGQGQGQGQGQGLVMSDGKRRKYKVMLLAGGDLIESFGEPGVWSEPDLHIILGRFGCLIVERAGSDVWAFLLSHDILYHHRRNVIVIKQLIYNDISSTKVRLFVRRGMSIKYLLPNSVIQYIYDHKLYRNKDIKTIAAAK